MIWILCLFAFFFTSCEQKPQATHYKEVVVQAPPQASPAAVSVAASPISADPHAGLDMSAMAGLMPAAAMGSATNTLFTWTAPQGWQEEPPSGMRLATFHLAADAKAIDCSIVSLGGMAGGLEANLRRWMGQIGLQATADELTHLIAAAPAIKIKTGQDGKIFDFTTIQTKALARDKSMIVVMVIVDEATLFVKMTGTLGTVAKNKDDFFKLVASVEYHAPSIAPMPPAAGLKASNDPHAGLDMSAMGPIIEQPTSQHFLSWVTPEGWIEEPGKHMRMATFHLAVDPQAIDCSIIALAGAAGGAEANLERWMGQLGIQASGDNLKQLVVAAGNFSTKDGLAGKVFDFTVLQPQGKPTDKSMAAAMITMGSTTVFVKMIGSMEAVKQNKDHFIKLLNSVSRKLN